MMNIWNLARSSNLKQNSMKTILDIFTCLCLLQMKFIMINFFNCTMKQGIQYLVGVHWRQPISRLYWSISTLYRPGYLGNSDIDLKLSNLHIVPFNVSSLCNLGIDTTETTGQDCLGFGNIAWLPQSFTF